MRRVETIKLSEDVNSMQYWYRVANPLRVCFNFVVITISRYLPFLGLKAFLLRKLLGMQVGPRASVGLAVMPDVLFPELITIGANTIIGYNTTILTHEFLVSEFRRGPVQIGSHVLIGANVTILPGVIIGDGARVGAGALVNRDIPPGALAAGVPARVVDKGRKGVAPDGSTD
ncbi:hypothetical protein Desca_2515 [Desulfotomaculum nigrificans CO-1-SRB]|uniref:Transferase hexapeptide repeat containing protein n=1 Tax=Desulfotomaculum nigrificans (strain DSM 14880 / VKM B-2319 / CO-1-SRB) TaxID=868595 RepID=F6B4W9_DESCC|nr:acyltransferase [Desulfotomaculum nigrificans]AEF95341.1 hypothetical protein Desca_2515 [Desulfotomaculum nigrificans CO-1-SRB]